MLLSVGDGSLDGSSHTPVVEPEKGDGEEQSGNS